MSDLNKSKPKGPYAKVGILATIKTQISPRFAGNIYTVNSNLGWKPKFCFL